MKQWVRKLDFEKLSAEQLYDLGQQFNALVVVDPNTKCRVWRGPVSVGGWPKFNTSAGMSWADAFAWAWAHHEAVSTGKAQALLPGQKLKHTCGYKDCVNPEHMTPETVVRPESPRLLVTDTPEETKAKLYPKPPAKAGSRRQKAEEAAALRRQMYELEDKLRKMGMKR